MSAGGPRSPAPPPPQACGATSPASRAESPCPCFSFKPPRGGAGGSRPPQARRRMPSRRDSWTFRRCAPRSRRFEERLRSGGSCSAAAEQQYSVESLAVTLLGGSVPAAACTECCRPIFHHPGTYAQVKSLLSARARGIVGRMGSRKQKISYFYDSDYAGFYYGADHPMKPQRMCMAHELILGYGLHERLDIVSRHGRNLQIQFFSNREKFCIFHRIHEGCP